MSKLNSIDQYFLADTNRLDMGAGKISQRLNCSKEEVVQSRLKIRALLKAQEVIKDNYIADLEEHIIEISNEKGTLKSTLETSFEPRTDIELAQLHKVDLTKYKISNYWTKQKSNGKFTSSLLCTLIKQDSDLKSQKELLLKELKSEKFIPFLSKKLSNSGKYAYEINIPDVHFGKLSWNEESGEDYNLKIAEDRYNKAINELLNLVNINEIERIIFPIGNDMINIDSRKNETFAGTKQDSDSRFFKIVRTVKNILIKNINSLSLIAPVDVIIISGNHDPESMFMIGEMLDAYYHNCPNVNIDNSPKQRKYYQYGLNGFQYTHGNEENHKDLGLIFATEECKLWANTEFRFSKLGHFHKNKKLNYVSIDEHQGFQIQILPSLSGTDAWHNSKGYCSKKQAKGFLYHKQNGQIAEYTYTL